MPQERDNFLDTFIVDFYSASDLKIKPVIGWGIDNKVSYYICTRNFNATITIFSKDLDGFRNVYIDTLISSQTDGGGIVNQDYRLCPKDPYYNAIWRILRTCGFLTLPVWHFSVKTPSDLHDWIILCLNTILIRTNTLNID